ncbi:hypothetical protein ABL78_4674 [Leptomonas seymouri]|uniref:ADP-ribosylation factor-like protein n=1 Tax=Leptomonas seymouri TaxID=5684 RepID=A0A0N1PBE8_LEPSE|nr:hypothetical protein ABL78_4674 [Leptomonas seymouri]|eukprot:KPI86248.1 hypothetical protein ABL78_4674 [Leptomonas seymouri]
MAAILLHCPSLILLCVSCHHIRSHCTTLCLLSRSGRKPCQPPHRILLVLKALKEGHKMRQLVAYVLGTESSGKTDLVRQLEYLSKGQLCSAPTKCTPTMGQEVSTLAVVASGGKRVTMELRELGGSVINVWESFIASRKAKDTAVEKTTFFLLYVVDATAPHQLPLASSMFRYLTEGSGAVCADWRTLVVLQKCSSVNAMTKEEARDYFADGERQNALCAVETDSWNGVGIGDVQQWLADAAREP